MTSTNAHSGALPGAYPNGSSGAAIGFGPPALVRDVAFVGQLMESLTVPVFVLDTDGRVMIWNRACEGLTGVAAAEVLGSAEHWRSFHDQYRPTLADQVLAARRGQACPRRPHTPSCLACAGDGRCPLGLSVESWYDMPRAGRRRYLAADANPIFDGAGRRWSRRCAT